MCLSYLANPLSGAKSSIWLLSPGHWSSFRTVHDNAEVWFFLWNYIEYSITKGVWPTCNGLGNTELGWWKVSHPDIRSSYVTMAPRERWGKCSLSQVNGVGMRFSYHIEIWMKWTSRLNNENHGKERPLTPSAKFGGFPYCNQSNEQGTASRNRPARTMQYVFCDKHNNASRFVLYSNMFWQT